MSLYNNHHRHNVRRRQAQKRKRCIRCREITEFVFDHGEEMYLCTNCEVR